MRTPSDRLKLFAGIVVVTLLLVIGYRQPTRSPVSGATPGSARIAVQPMATAPDTTAVATRRPTRPTTERLKKPSAAPLPTRPAPVPSEQTASRPVQPVPNSAEAEPVQKPSSAPCSQLVLRSGDLVDAHVTEIGTREVRYKKCHWTDGPEHVILRADVLSIRFANGEIERL